MLEYLFAAFSRFSDDDEGQTAVEYALVLMLVAIVLVVVLNTGLVGALTGAVSKIAASLS